MQYQSNSYYKIVISDLINSGMPSFKNWLNFTSVNLEKMNCLEMINASIILINALELLHSRMLIENSIENASIMILRCLINDFSHLQKQFQANLKEKSKRDKIKTSSSLFF